MSDDTKILGFDASQADAVASELQNVVMDLIRLSEAEGEHKAVPLVVTALALRIAILTGLVTEGEAVDLAVSHGDNFRAIAQGLQVKAISRMVEG